MNMNSIFPVALDAVVLECRDVAALSDFYIRLLGWNKNPGADDEWVDISHPSGGAKIAFQQNVDYVSPVWPDEPGQQQQMAHLDFTIKNVEQMKCAVAHALACGAVIASSQYGGEKYTTLIDPEGHPFCFVIW